jgi:hypothetical protein
MRLAKMKRRQRSASATPAEFDGVAAGGVERGDPYAR